MRYRLGHILAPCFMPMTLKPFNKCDDISSSIEACIPDLSILMNSNMLKLNKDKIELIVFSSRQRVKKSDKLRIMVGPSFINISMCVRNLGFILDNTLVGRSK